MMKKAMKVFILIIFMFLFIFMFVACDKKATSTQWFLKEYDIEEDLTQYFSYFDKNYEKNEYSNIITYLNKKSQSMFIFFKFNNIDEAKNEFVIDCCGIALTEKDSPFVCAVRISNYVLFTGVVPADELYDFLQFVGLWTPEEKIKFENKTFTYCDTEFVLDSDSLKKFCENNDYLLYSYLLDNNMTNYIILDNYGNYICFIHSLSKESAKTYFGDDPSSHNFAASKIMFCENCTMFIMDDRFMEILNDYVK